MGKQTIPFNTPLVVDGQLENVQDALSTPATLTGNGKYTAQCLEYFRSLAPQSRAYLTTSGTAALEFAALVIGIEPGDEVIVPSYTYVSTINAFLLRGATLVYVDVDPGTMNIDHHKIEAAITSKTRAIAPVHYSSIACDMDVILDIAKRHNLKIIEDAACCLSAKFKSQALGSIGDVGCFSFHATKNYNAGGQGGAILVNDPELFDKADTVFENGTNRRQFARGETSRYEWQDLGSNFYMSETSAACLAAQVSKIEDINSRRLKIWQKYYHSLVPLAEQGLLHLPQVPSYAQHNAHIFWIRLGSNAVRGAFIEYMKQRGITTPFHYVSLHLLPIGIRTGRFHGEDHYTSEESAKLVRLPLFFHLTDSEVEAVLNQVFEFFRERGDWQS